MAEAAPPTAASPKEAPEEPAEAAPSPDRVPKVETAPEAAEDVQPAAEPAPVAPNGDAAPPSAAEQPPPDSYAQSSDAQQPQQPPYDANGSQPPYDYSQYYNQPPPSASHSNGSGTPAYGSQGGSVPPMSGRSGHAADVKNAPRGVLNPQKIYIGGLPEHTREEDLQDCFSQLGNVTGIELKAGFGFVEFDDIVPAQEAVSKYHGGHFLGAEIRVELSHNGSKAKPYVGGEAGACFKCGRTGHWARDCVGEPMRRMPPGPPPPGRGRGAPPGWGPPGPPPPVAPMHRGYHSYQVSNPWSAPTGYPGYDMYGMPYGAPAPAPPPPQAGRNDDYYRREYGYGMAPPPAPYPYPYGAPPPMAAPGYAMPPSNGYRPSGWGGPGSPPMPPGAPEPYSPLPNGRPPAPARRRSLSPSRRDSGGSAVPANGVPFRR